MKRNSLYTLLLLLLGTPMLLAQTMPRVDLWFDTLSSTTFHTGNFRLVNNTDTVSLPIEIRHRGASSLQYDKPSYAVKLYDTLGVKFDTTLLGMRSDNYWILDAMAIDKARMRNRVAMDLWLEFSRRPWYQNLEPKMINGYNGQMVEVYVNGAQQGIYCLMERVDRKQLKLKKFSEKKGVQGLLYKSVSNYRTVIYYLWNTPSETEATWDGWEQKYPDAEDGEPISWDRFYRHIHALTRTYNSTYADTAKTHLDMPVYIDYVLLCQLLAARDNVSKNIHVSFYDANTKRALYTPWDLDHSWGRQYNSQIEVPDQVVKFNDNYLYKRMVTYYHIQDTLQARYAELREHYFTIEHIDSLFAHYFHLYAATGMDTIEAKLWSGHNNISLDLPTERQYIHDWVIARLAYTDSLYHYTAPVRESREDSLLREVSSWGLPVVRITTTDGQNPTSDDILHPSGLYGQSITNLVTKTGRMEIFRADSLWYHSGEYLSGNRGIKIRHRGNTSAYGRPDKPFKITLQKAADLMEHQTGDTIRHQDTEWLLLNSAKSINALIGHQLGKAIAMEYTPRIEPVNIILNGEYYGLYYLSESVKCNPACRIQIDANTGYIMEYDCYFWNEEFSLPTSLSNTREWTLKSPKYSSASPEHLDFIQCDIQRLELSVDSADYDRVIDVQSFAQWQMAHDILATQDAAGTNPYVTRHDSLPGTLMHMPVLWDFDKSFPTTTNTWAATHNKQTFVFGHLFQDTCSTVFAEAYLDKWDSICNHNLFDQLYDYLANLPTSQEGIGMQLSYPHHRARWSTSAISSISSQSDHIKTWLEQHYLWMMEQMNELKKQYRPQKPDIATSVSPNEASEKASKILRNGDLYIHRSNQLYDMLGRKLQDEKQTDTK